MRGASTLVVEWTAVAPFECDLISDRVLHCTAKHREKGGLGSRRPGSNKKKMLVSDAKEQIEAQETEKLMQVGGCCYV